LVVRTILLALLLSSCFKSVKLDSKPLEGDSPPWCLDVVFRYENDKNTQRARLCYERLAACNGALKKVRQYGSLANVKSVTDCEKI
jgi:hypothetical protein